MRTPRNLKVWRHALELATETYRVTSQFPAAERVGLTAHLRRTAISIGSNIAEGCGRRGDRELLAFFHISLGSVSEFEFQLAVASSLGLAERDQLASLERLLSVVRRMLVRLIIAVRQRTA